MRAIITIPRYGLCRADVVLVEKGRSIRGFELVAKLAIGRQTAGVDIGQTGRSIIITIDLPDGPGDESTPRAAAATTKKWYRSDEEKRQQHRAAKRAASTKKGITDGERMVR